jgi:hypothetical protein
MSATPFLSRRRFLALTGGAFVLAACGGSDSSDTTLEHSHSEPTELVPGVMSSDLYAHPEPQRVAFAMFEEDGAYASGGAVTFAVAPQDATPTDFVPTTLYTEGLPDKRGIYVAEVVLDAEGVWSAIADRDGKKSNFFLQVNAKASAPTVGSKAPTDASPTVDDPLGMDPICTRDPQCPLHTKSLDTVIGKGKPVAVLFATPARCASQYCGPVLDALLPLVEEYQDRVEIVHCDIYLNNRTQEVSPTVDAWGLPSEPWLFGVDAAGAITARLDGAMGQEEMRAVLDSLAS